MGLKDEVSGVEGSIRIDNFLRTGLKEMYQAPGRKGYVAEKAESDSGWLLPVGRRSSRIGLQPHVMDMLTPLKQAKNQLRIFMTDMS